MVYVGTVGNYARVTSEKDCLPPNATEVIGYPDASIDGTAELYRWAGFLVDTEGE